MPHQFLIDKGPGDLFENLKPEVRNFFFESRVNTHRYLFQSDACAKVGEFLRDCFDLVVQHNEFARPPYDNIYIEMADQPRLFSVWKGAPAFTEDVTTDRRIGMLIKNGYMVTMSEAFTRHNNKVSHSVTLWSVGLNRPQSAGLNILGNAEDQQVVKAAHITGAMRKNQKNMSPGWDDVNWQLPVHQIKEFSAMYDMRCNIDLYRDGDMTEEDRRILRHGCFLGSGDPMIALAALLLLNQQTPHINTTPIGHSSGIVKGKRVVYKAHSIVGIHLEGKRAFRKMFAQIDRASPVRHEVRGHWTHRGAKVRCEHHWEPRDLSGKRYVCAHCGLRRTWRPPHERGTAEKGYNTKHYVVSR